MVRYQMAYTMDGTMHRSTMGFLWTKILSARSFLIMGNMDGMVYQFTDTLPFGSRNRNNRNAEHLLHAVDHHRSSIPCQFIHHIQSQHHRNIQFHQLHGQIQVSFNIRRIHNIDDAMWMRFENKLPRYNFLSTIW